MRGAALLMVLWLVLLLAGLVAGYALTARVESLQGNGV
ncbi:MAG TPA: general secretion pathway protein GspK, partial [Thermomonas sp.]|nr:general secretion pathway protein GspK [Thermomonas sp.]